MITHFGKTTKPLLMVELQVGGRAMVLVKNQDFFHDAWNGAYFFQKR
jgi:hypothetical protein